MSKLTSTNKIYEKRKIVQASRKDDKRRLLPSEGSETGWHQYCLRNDDILPDLIKIKNYGNHQKI